MSYVFLISTNTRWLVSVRGMNTKSTIFSLKKFAILRQTLHGGLRHHLYLGCLGFALGEGKYYSKRLAPLASNSPLANILQT